MDGIYPFATGNVYGLSVCSPINDENNYFVGSYCADILPTMSVSKNEQ